MSFLNYLIPNAWVGTSEQWKEYRMPQLLGTGTNSFNLNDAADIGTVYTCLRILSDVVGRLPINIMSAGSKGPVVDKNDYRYPILHYNPNAYTNSCDFFGTLEYLRNLHGNAFAWIHRKGGKVEYLEILPTSQVEKPVVVNNKLYYKYNQIQYDSNGVKSDEKKIVINGDDIIHVKHVSPDGVWGVSPLKKLALDLSLNWKAKKTADSFYTNNGFAPFVLKWVGDMMGPNKKHEKEGLELFKSENAEFNNKGNYMTLPYGMDVTQLSLDLIDAQIIETIKYTKGEMASLYGIPPHLVALYESSKFNNVEQMMLGFKVETISANLRKWRQELEFKMLTTSERVKGKSIEFNTGALVETDYKTKIEGISKLIQSSMITPNQANEILGYPTYDGGDYHQMPSNFMFVETRAKSEEDKLKPLVDSSIN